jgi:hypothetical protein
MDHGLRQFGTKAEHNCWVSQEISTYLMTALQGQASDMLHGVPNDATYEEALETLEYSFGDQHLATAYHSQLKTTAYHSQLKTKTQGVRESLLEFAIAIKQLAHHTYPTLPKDDMREAGKAFTDGVEDPNIKIQLLLGEDGKRGCPAGP